MDKYHKYKDKYIVICEGPAGAGKSFLLKQLAEIPEVGVVSQSLMKRSFETVEAGHKSFFNDIAKIQSALVDDSPVIFIDRCFVSQRVYHAIRTKGSLWKDDLGQISSDNRILVRRLEQDFASRLGLRERNIHLSYLLLIPSLEILEARRLIGGKKYPNDPVRETALYKDASHRLSAFEPSLRPRYDTPDDTNYIVRGYRQWLSTYPNIDSHPFQSFANTPYKV